MLIAIGFLFTHFLSLLSLMLLMLLPPAALLYFRIDFLHFLHADFRLFFADFLSSPPRYFHYFIAIIF